MTHCAADFFGLGPAVPGGLGVRATRTRSFAHSHIPGRPPARPSVRISDERSVSIHEWGGGSECRRLRSPAGGRGPRQGGVGKVFKCVGLAAEREGSRLLRPEGKAREEVVAARHRCVLVAVVMEEDGGKKSDQRWSKRIKRSQSSGKISQAPAFADSTKFIARSCSC